VNWEPLVVEAIAVASLLLLSAWIYAEFRLGRAARLALGLGLVVLAAMTAAGIRELQYRHFAFRVTQALREVSRVVGQGSGDAVHAPIERFSDATKHDPSLAAAVELVTDLQRIESNPRPAEAAGTDSAEEAP
jgi:hypothetical protein